MTRSPSKIFSKLRELFDGMGLMNQEITIEVSGRNYKIKCDQDSFMVYRLHNNVGPRSHVPGWPVCLVNQDTIFEECSSADGVDDYFSCGLTIERWIELLETDKNKRVVENGTTLDRLSKL